MTRVAEPAVTSHEIVFELERFERSGGQLNLAGRWFGVRGRRFVRPTLTLALEGERTRALADLDDKPWPAEDGEPWKASFPWSKRGRVEGPELSVAPDITIQLPAPNGRRARPQRLAAQPRREVMNASYGAFAAPAETPPIHQELNAAPQALEAATPEPAPPEPDPVVESLRGELTSVGAQLEQARRELGERGSELEALGSELSRTRDGREVALRGAAEAEAEREAALVRAAEAEAERDRLTTEKTELIAALEASRLSVEQLTRQHEDIVASRGAALVMRGATPALHAYEHRVGWVRRVLAVLVLIAIVFALLIVLGAL